MSSRYFFTLTGDDDGEDDVEIPISSFQARFRSGDPSYLQVTIPYTSTYADYITARPSADMVIEMGYYLSGVETLREEIFRVDLENVGVYQGSKNQSITLSGHRTQTPPAKAMTLTDPIYKSVYNGVTTYRFGLVDPYVRPGDTLTVGSDTFTVGMITYTVSISSGGSVQQSMEVKEDE